MEVQSALFPYSSSVPVNRFAIGICSYKYFSHLELASAPGGHSTYSRTAQMLDDL